MENLATSGTTAAIQSLVWSSKTDTQCRWSVHSNIPFGISSAPELFQRRMNMILEGLNGVLCHMDDVLVYGANQTEHDARLRDVMKRLEAAGVTLNSDKCKFGRDRVKFLGHLIDREGIRADPEKTSAILQILPMWLSYADFLAW